MVFKSHDESIAHERTVHSGQQKPQGSKGDKSDKGDSNEGDNKVADAKK